jgi:hypothetical protein
MRPDDELDDLDGDDSDHDGDADAADDAVPDVAGEAAMSAALFLAGRKVKMSAQRCGHCRITFVAAEQLLTIHGYEEGKWSLDVGGYCSRCALFICHLDARFAPAKRSEKEAPGAAGWRPVCGTCGEALSPGPGSGPDGAFAVFYLR